MTKNLRTIVTTDTGRSFSSVPSELTAEDEANLPEARDQLEALVRAFGDPDSHGSHITLESDIAGGFTIIPGNRVVSVIVEVWEP